MASIRSSGRFFQAHGTSLGRSAMNHVPYMLRFGLVGGSGVLVNYTILYLLTAIWGLNHLAAAALATEGAILSNFTLNNLWTFRAAMPGGSWARRGLCYNVFALGGLIISVAVLAALTYLLHMHYLMANIFAIGAATLWNYAANYHWTWSVALFTHPTLNSEADRA